MPVCDYSTTTDSYDTDKMRDEFRMQFSPVRLALKKDQFVVFQYLEQKMLMLHVKDMEGRLRSYLFAALGTILSNMYLVLYCIRLGQFA